MAIAPLSRGAALGATIVSAVLFGLAFPPWGLKPLAWIALAPFFTAIRAGGLARSAALAALWSVLAAWVVGDWMPDAVAVYFMQPKLVGFLFFLGIALTMAAPYYVGFAAAYHTLSRRYGRRVLPLLGAAAWVAAELGRGRLFTGSALFIGNPWALIGYSQIGFDPLMQIACVTGIYGVGFAVAAVNAGVAELLLALRATPGALWGALQGLALSALPAMAVLAFGAVDLATASPKAIGAGEPVPVAIVQGHVDLGSRWRADFYGRNLDVYLDGTLDALRRARPALVIWPESALTFFLEDEPAFQHAIARVLEAGDVELLAGGPRSEGETSYAPGAPQPRYFNSLFLLSPDGRIRARYDKEFLVPFSEYFPFQGLDLLRRQFERVRVFTPGSRISPIRTRAGPAGILICNEGMLPEVAATRVRAGAEILVNPSNDTWIASQKFAEQLFELITLRAVEERRWLIRASTSGPSAIVDPWGRIEVRSAPFTRDVLTGTVRPVSELTAYARVGDLFALSCVGVVAGMLLAGRLGVRSAARRRDV